MSSLSCEEYLEGLRSSNVPISSQLRDIQASPASVTEVKSLPRDYIITNK